MIENILEKIRKDTDSYKMLEEFSDFTLCDEAVNSSEYLFYTKENFEIIATTSGGGVYGIIGDGDKNSLPVGYISSEGQSGKIANSLTELISLIVYYPFWSDVIKWSYESTDEEIEDLIDFLEDERLEDMSDYYEVQNELAQKFEAEKDENAIVKLHDLITEEPVFTVYSTIDDHPSESLLQEMNKENI